MIPPELRRRFKAGIWFFDLPTDEEKIPIWGIHRKAYEIPKDDPKPSDEEWTGAEIRNCCEMAWALDTTLVEASKYILPVAKSSPDAVRKLREAASGKWFSASYEGAYQLKTFKKAGRKVNPSMN